MKKTITLIAFLLAIFTFGNTVQAQFGIKNLTKKKKPTEKVLDIEVYTNEARTERITSLKITKTTKLFCRANLSNDIEGIDFYADKADSYSIYLSLQHLEASEGKLADEQQIYYHYAGKIPNGKRNWIEYQKENKYFDFVIDMADENSNSAFTDRLKNNDFK